MCIRDSTYPWYTPKYPNDTGTPYWTYGTIKAGEGICVKDTNWQPNLCNNVPSSTGINFLSDDMAVIDDNQKWRSSVEQARAKLNTDKKV